MGKRKTKEEATQASASTASSRKKEKKTAEPLESRLYGEPVPAEEARERWLERYDKKKKSKNARGSGGNKKEDTDEEVLLARCHYRQAEVDGCIFNLNDDAYVKGEEGKPNYIGRIVELFETTDGEPYFTAQWFFKAEDTVIGKDHSSLIDSRRVFLSNMRDDNPLDCIVSKIQIAQVSPNMDLVAKQRTIPSSCDLYYDMSYSPTYSTFANLSIESTRAGSETSSTISSEVSFDGAEGECKPVSEKSSSISLPTKPEIALLDLYSGCGAMSTGLCLGAAISGINLVTRWAVDLNQYACESLRLNHPETVVRNETAENFLALLKKWEQLCRKFSLLKADEDVENLEEKEEEEEEEEDDDDDDEGDEKDDEFSEEVFEVEKILGICFGDPNESQKKGLYFKVRWKGYGPSEDTWEPFGGLGDCKERLCEFVEDGYRSKILPLPGDVDVICGGPPCQGISGFNRFRNVEAPLDDPKNHQMVVFMDIVEYLKPKFVLMENVVDILKFAQGFLGRYAIGRLVAMNYQARLGLLAAGCYGLPQFRMRVFLWGARPTEKLPQYPLPTHEVVVRGGIPNEFERNTVAFDEDQPCKLEKALLLGDAISDLPSVTNFESRDEMPYSKAPKTDFQKYIRLSRNELGVFASRCQSSQKAMLFDHCPLQLNEDDYQRVCRIPKKKGANFRDLPGVLVRPDNVVEWDKSVERVFLPSGKPLVPDYAMSFVRGTSTKPFGRLWWDETVPTVVTRAEPHNQIILHPEQDRVLTIRENARLQGFLDFYKLCGPVKERYIQVGNAVAVPVARALGYALGLAYRGICDEEPLLVLPQKFPNSLKRVPSESIEDDVNS
ncbi:PREDICTED: DNA (cytosine-5)-methyltransferase 1-like isoform X2 [Nelumbo nucifera]|uniref:DNA (cytosine-5-)-methyltransferase n=1 Tax=Nelumbo nucifera TaxID=4432 RepID=A0A1U7Z744_NELNU|nr:PREDICTED: DNA (cytosine-5)-methyltransferase 1-like isoform X2 [Nelumbo nucifera]